jgi:hypothetical protein
MVCVTALVLTTYSTLGPHHMHAYAGTVLFALNLDMYGDSSDWNLGRNG